MPDGDGASVFCFWRTDDQKSSLKLNYVLVFSVQNRRVFCCFPLFGARECKSENTMSGLIRWNEETAVPIRKLFYFLFEIIYFEMTTNLQHFLFLSFNGKIPCEKNFSLAYLWFLISFIHGKIKKNTNNVTQLIKKPRFLNFKPIWRPVSGYQSISSFILQFFDVLV